MTYTLPFRQPSNQPEKCATTLVASTSSSTLSNGLSHSRKAPKTPDKTPSASNTPIHSPLLLTDRDYEILQTLTKRVRVLSLDQVARTWWPTSRHAKATALARLGNLEAKYFVHIHRAPAHPEIQLSEPALTWEPGKTVPDFGPIAYRLRARWNQHPVMTTCIAATKTAANVFSGHGGRLPREVERTHDIHLAAVYLLYRSRVPELLSSWIFEERLRQERRPRGARLPDVLLRLPAAPRIIEFGGAYSKTKLQEFHIYCEEQSLPYEVW